MLHFASANDINISLDIEGGVLCDEIKRRQLAETLFNKYLARDFVNLVRGYATCPICGEDSFYFKNDEKIKLSRCTLILKSGEKNVLIPVQWIHLLQQHEVLVDDRLMQHFSFNEC